MRASGQTGGGGGPRLNRSAANTLRLLETCPLLPVDAFVHLAGLSSVSGAYKQLARLRRAGLAEVQRVDLGYLLGERPLGLWRITEQGRQALDITRAEPRSRNVGTRRQTVGGPHRQVHQAGANLTLLVAAYRLLAWFVVDRAPDGQKFDVRTWEQPWIRSVWSAERTKLVRATVPAGAVLTSRAPSVDRARTTSGQRVPVLLVPDFGTAPVARNRETLRRLVAVVDAGLHLSSDDPEPELVIATVDPDGKGARSAAWLELVDRIARRQARSSLRVHVVGWEQVADVVGRRRVVEGFRYGPLQPDSWKGSKASMQPSRAPVRGQAQLLHLIGRHPCLTVEQLARLLSTTTSRVRRIELELIDRGWLRRIELAEMPDGAIAMGHAEWRVLGLVEVTIAGRRELASWLGLEPTPATRYHGLIGNSRGLVGRRRRLLRTLAHTVGTNAVFVAFAVAADAASRQGGTDQLAEWRSAAACERRHCKPDGYGRYVRNGISYGFFLEYDRGTEPARKYASKFRAYYRYRESGQAGRDYDGFPTLLFVTSAALAEHRIAEQAYRAWFVRDVEPVPMLITTTARIESHREGILGPIWRSPAPSRPSAGPEFQYWLPGGGSAATTGIGPRSPRVPRLLWATGLGGKR